MELGIHRYVQESVSDIDLEGSGPREDDYVGSITPRLSPESKPRRNNQTTLLLLNNHWPDEDTINPPFFHRSKGKHVQLTLSVDKTAHAPTKLEKKSEETLLSTAAATTGMTKATNNEDLRNASKWCEIWLVPVEAGDLSTDKGWRRRNPRPPNSGERQGNDRY